MKTLTRIVKYESRVTKKKPEVDEEKICICVQTETILFEFNCWRGADLGESCEPVSLIFKWICVMHIQMT